MKDFLLSTIETVKVKGLNNNLIPGDLQLRLYSQCLKNTFSNVWFLMLYKKRHIKNNQTQEKKLVL